MAKKNRVLLKELRANAAEMGKEIAAAVLSNDLHLGRLRLNTLAATFALLETLEADVQKAKKNG